MADFLNTRSPAELVSGIDVRACIPPDLSYTGYLAMKDFLRKWADELSSSGSSELLFGGKVAHFVPKQATKSGQFPVETFQGPTDLNTYLPQGKPWRETVQTLVKGGGKRLRVVAVRRLAKSAEPEAVLFYDRAVSRFVELGKRESPGESSQTLGEDHFSGSPVISQPGKRPDLSLEFVRIRPSRAPKKSEGPDGVEPRVAPMSPPPSTLGENDPTPPHRVAGTVPRVLKPLPLQTPGVEGCGVYVAMQKGPPSHTGVCGVNSSCLLSFPFTLTFSWSSSCTPVAVPGHAVLSPVVTVIWPCWPI